MQVATGTFVTVDAPNGEWIEGRITADVEDIYETPFTLVTSDGPVRVERPWDCDIAIE